ncbi:MAG: hypothetical protein KUL86_05990 [Castellaniella sp.]|nr:hypothetical protein [Castellaniella sp.]
MHIEFIKNHGVYSPGDIAGFDPAVAEVLIGKGVAVRKQWGDSPAPQVDAGSDDSGLGDANQDDRPARGRRK